MTVKVINSTSFAVSWQAPGEGRGGALLFGPNDYIVVWTANDSTQGLIVVAGDIEASVGNLTSNTAYTLSVSVSVDGKVAGGSASKPVKAITCK